MACRLCGAKPLSKPMLEYCWFDLQNKYHWILNRLGLNVLRYCLAGNDHMPEWLHRSTLFRSGNASGFKLDIKLQLPMEGWCDSSLKQFVSIISKKMQGVMINVSRADLALDLCWRPGMSHASAWASLIGRAFLLVVIYTSPKIKLILSLRQWKFTSSKSDVHN